MCFHVLVWIWLSYIAQALWTSWMHVDTAGRMYKRVWRAVKCLPLVYLRYCDFWLFFFFLYFSLVFIKADTTEMEDFFIYLFYLSACQNPPWGILVAIEQCIGHYFCSVGHSSHCTVSLSELQTRSTERKINSSSCRFIRQLLPANCF